MNMSKQRCAQFLTYAGVIPFIFLAKLSIFNIHLFNIAAYPLLLVYAAVIAAFISGIHWGVYLFKEVPINLFIRSNIVTLIAWLAAAGMLPMNVLILAACFIYLYLIDVKLIKQGLTEIWFHKLRTHASIMVVISLLLVAVFV